MASDHAAAQSFRARGEWRALYPSFDLGAQYGLFSNTLNNYKTFIPAFQRNNATFGIAIRLPIFNYTQRARAAQADAEAVKAKKQIETTKNQVSSETLKLQRAVRQLSAAQQVADLEYQLAKSEAEATDIRSQSASAPLQPQAAAVSGVVTARDVANAHMQATDKYSQYLDTNFELQKTRLQLLRATGELEQWALPAK
jgi:outer membrane protein TolC